MKCPAGVRSLWLPANASAKQIKALFCVDVPRDFVEAQALSMNINASIDKILVTLLLLGSASFHFGMKMQMKKCCHAAFSNLKTRIITTVWWKFETPTEVNISNINKVVFQLAASFEFISTQSFSSIIIQPPQCSPITQRSSNARIFMRNSLI